ncbi:MAG: hypothetical protein JO032_08910 [Alphaproteobacteria bacterium]|nr:hypothetical protein [Alphaproteobacteria bacterium]
MRIAWLGLALLGGLAAPALAQVPPYPPAPPLAVPAPALPGANCYCLKQAMDETAADRAARQNALAAAQAQLGQLDTRLAEARAREDVKNPQSVAEFRQLLAQRDAAFRDANGAPVAESQAATARYNQAVAAYNAQCAGRPLPPPPPGPLICPGPR